MKNPVKGSPRLVWCLLWVPLALALGRSEAIAQCDDCFNFSMGSTTWHYFSDEWRPLPNLYDGSHQTSQPGSCSQMHEPCDSEELDLEVLAEDAAALKQVLEGGSRAVVFNQERGALQLISCEGTVIGHLPLNEEQLAVLLEQ